MFAIPILGKLWNAGKGAKDLELLCRFMVVVDLILEKIMERDETLETVHILSHRIFVLEHKESGK